MSRLARFRGQRQEIEWVGGRYTVPYQVHHGDSAFQPEVFLWLELPRGILLTSKLVDPRSPVSFGQSLEDAIHHPVEGRPRRPSRIRVADQQAADELRAVAGGIPIVIAGVPELDEVFEDLAATMDAATREPSYFDDAAVTPQLIQELFKAASLLFRTAPWRRMHDEQIVRVDIPRFGIDGACLSVIGRAGESFGLMLFSSIDDYHAFIRAAGGAQPATDGRLALRSLSFNHKNDLPPSLVREVEQHRWPVASRDAYPVVFSVRADLDPSPVTEADIRIMTAVTRAFLAFFIRHREMFDDDQPELARESSDGGDGVTVTLTAPYAVFDDDSFKRPAPPVREPMPKVGRNDPCPCGSGKKYKKCHL